MDYSNQLMDVGTAEVKGYISQGPSQAPTELVVDYRYRFDINTSFKEEELQKEFKRLAQEVVAFAVKNGTVNYMSSDESVNQQRKEKW